jgi:LPLT family lysophospholipid transporter-like MFS transporter
MNQPPALHRRAMRAVLGSQFFTSLADNALLIVAIGLLAERGSPAWMTPALRICLYVSYVVLAPVAGALADAFPKGRVMLLTNLVKLGACLLLAANAHPLLAFGAIGVAGVTYGPAKYGILAELVPPADLIMANAWIEISTVASILGGTALGGFLLAPTWIVAGLGSPARSASLAILGMYAVSALFAAAIPATGAVARIGRLGVRERAAGFWREFAVLWRDAEGKISLFVTTLFWAMAAALQFLVIQWGGAVLGLTLSQSALMQCFLAVGMVAGSVAVARFVAPASALAVLPAGLALGAAILLMTVVSGLWLACAMLLLTGVVAGIVLVPMNALLQQRGDALMEPGVSIAVQSFNENLASLVFLAAHGALLVLDVPVRAILAGFGFLVIALMVLIMRWHRVSRGVSVFAGQQR